MPLPFASPTSMPDAARSTAAAALQPLVTSGVALSLAAQHAHWNVKGPSAGPLHALFGELYGALTGYTDKFAERIATLGGTPNGLEVVGASPAAMLSAFLKDTASQDGLAYCRALVPMVRAYVEQADLAFNAMTEARMTADANALQDVVETAEKIGWKVAVHVPDLKLPEPGAPTPAVPPPAS
jgi:starvation-inducible DNA-binding protein